MCVDRQEECRSPFTLLTGDLGNPRPRPHYTVYRRGTGAEFNMALRYGYQIFKTITANACLTKLLNTKHYGLDIDELKRKMMEPKKAVGTLHIMDPHLERTWQNIKDLDDDDIMKDVEEIMLFGYAFGQHHMTRASKFPDADLRSMRWSFCRDGWVNRHRVKHCFECNECFDDAWYCSVCGVCNTPRQYPCAECNSRCQDMDENTRAERVASRARHVSPPARAEASKPAVRAASRKRPRASNTETTVESQSAVAAADHAETT